MVTKKDLIACYHLVAAYIRNPSAADSITELIVDLPVSGKYPYTELSPPLSADALPTEFDGDVHDSIIEHAKSLGLDDDTTALMLESLEKKKDNLSRNDPSTSNKPKRARWEVPEDTFEYNSTITALLVSLLPNLTSFRFFEVDRHQGTLRAGYPNTSKPSPLARFLEATNSGSLPKSYLTKLETVILQPVNCVDERNYDYLTDMKRFHCFHQLPSVRTLSLVGLEDYQADYSNPPPTRSSPMRKICMRHVDMSGEMVARIISLSKELEELEYSTFGLMSTDGGFSSVYHAILGRCLGEYRGSLRVLDLDCRVSAGGRRDFDAEEEGLEKGEEEDDGGEEGEEKEGGGLQCARKYPEGSIGRLDDFGVLTHLSIVSFYLSSLCRPSLASTNSVPENWPTPRLRRHLPRARGSYSFSQLSTCGSAASATRVVTPLRIQEGRKRCD